MFTFWSELGFDLRVRSKIGKGISQVLVINRVRVLGSGPHTPTQFFWEYPPPGVTI